MIYNINLNQINKEKLPIIGNGRSGNVYKVNDNLVIKEYTNNPIRRMGKEVSALKILQKYKYFPKIYHIDINKNELYMSNVGKSLKYIHIKYWPINWKNQIEDIINILKKNNIFHNDLSISHLMLKNNIISLIDFEKSCINCCKIKTPDDEYYKYPDMDYLKEIVLSHIIKKYKKLIKK